MTETALAPIPASDLSADFDELVALPKELGILLIVAGIGGVLLPGPVGGPFLILGGAVLCPSLFRGVDRSFARRFPKTHHESMRQVKRYLCDMEKRYPSKRPR